MAFCDLHNPPEIQRHWEQEGSFSTFPELEYVHPEQSCKGHARIGSSSEVDAWLGHAQVIWNNLGMSAYFFNLEFLEI